jgi:hypothetical protein
LVICCTQCPASVLKIYIHFVYHKRLIICIRNGIDIGRQTKQWPNEKGHKGQTTIYKLLHRENNMLTDSKNAFINLDYL